MKSWVFALVPLVLAAGCGRKHTPEQLAAAEARKAEARAQAEAKYLAPYKLQALQYCMEVLMPQGQAKSVAECDQIATQYAPLMAQAEKEKYGTGFVGWMNKRQEAWDKAPKSYNYTIPLPSAQQPQQQLPQPQWPKSTTCRTRENGYEAVTTCQ